MVCASEREDTPQALLSELLPVQMQSHTITKNDSLLNCSGRLN